MAAAAVVAAVGTAISIKGSIDAARAQAAQAREEADARRSQAQEIFRRGELDLESLRLEGREFISKQEAAFVKGGVDVSSKTVLSVLEDSQSQILRQITETQRELEFGLNTAFLSADSLEDFAQRARKAGQTRAVGQAVVGSVQLFLASR